MFQFNGLFPQTAINRRNIHTLFFLRCPNGRHFLEPLQTGFLFGGTCLRPTTHPFQFVPQEILTFFLLGKKTFFPFRFHFQIFCKVCLIGINLPFFQFQHTVCYPIQEITVMGYHQKGFGVFFQMFFQPFHSIVVNMVGRFVQNQQIHRRNQCRCQCHSFPLTAGKSFYGLGKIRNTQTSQDVFGFAFQRPRFCLVHFFGKLCRLFCQFFIGRVCFQGFHGAFVFPHQCHHRIIPIKNLFQHSSPWTEHRGLGQIPHTHTVHGNDFPTVRLIHACNDFQQGRLPCAVDTYYTNFIPFVDAEGNIVKNHSCTITFTDILRCQ